MLRKNITYTNPFTETEVTEEHYFHIYPAHLVEMEMEEHGQAYVAKDGRELTGMQAKLQRIIDSEDGKAILVEFKALIQRSYGKRVGDGFIQNDEIWSAFSSSGAYSQLLFELCTDAEVGGQFMAGIIPANLDLEAAKLQAKFQAQEQAKTEAPTIAAVEKLADATGADFPKEETPVTVPERVLQDGPPPEDPTGLTNPVTPQVLTVSQAAALGSEELASGLASGKYKLS